jgi:hypothetical protein
VLFLRQFVARGDLLDDFLILRQQTGWTRRDEITWELDASLDDHTYRYRLEVGPSGESAQPRVVSETLRFDGKPIFEFVAGEVHLYNDQFEQKVTYGFDWHRSALATSSNAGITRSWSALRIGCPKSIVFESTRSRCRLARSPRISLPM